MTTKIPVELSSTPGIVDNSNATAITIDSSENIGIGTSSPASNQGFGKTVEISDEGATTGPDLMLTNPTAGTDEFIGQLSFNHANDALAAINAKTDGATDAGHIQFQTQKTSGAIAERLRISGNNLFLNGGTDARIQLGTGGAGANSTSNDTVHIRGDGDDLKLMMAADGQMVIEQNGSERLRVNALGVLSNKSANNIIRTEAQSYLTLGDDSSVTLFLGTAGSTLLSVYEGGSGSGAIVWLSYSESSGGNFIKSGGVLNFSSSDTDGQICVIKSSNSHTATVKNRTGAARNFALAMYGAKIDSSNS